MKMRKLFSMLALILCMLLGVSNISAIAAVSDTTVYIDKLIIDGFHTPIVGQEIPQTIAYTAYSVDGQDISGAAFDVEAEWYIVTESGNSQAVTLPTVFEEGKTYFCILCFSTRGSYSMSNNFNFNVNFVGDNVAGVYAVESYSSDFDVVSKDMAAIKIDNNEINDGLIKSIKVDGFHTPVVGQKIPETIAYTAYSADGQIMPEAAFSSVYVDWYIVTESGPYQAVTLPAVFEEGKTYRCMLGFNAGDSYDYSENFNIEVDNESSQSRIFEGWTLWVISEDMAAIKKDNYEIIDGANQSYTIDSNKEITVKANGEFTKFVGVEVDGASVLADKYTAVSGSTIITLKPEYLNTLSVGTHTMKILYNDGDVSTSFTIAAKAEEAVVVVNETSKQEKVDESPKTGDTAMYYIVMLLLSILGSSIIISGKVITGKNK